MTLSYSLFANLLSSYSSPFAAMHFVKTFNRFSAAILQSKMEVSVMNDGRSTVFSTTQSLCFPPLAMLPTATRRITSVIGIQILLSAMAKAMSMSMAMTENTSRDPARLKALMDSLMKFFPIDACPDVSWTSPGMALLVNMAVFGKSSHTYLN